LHSPNVDPRGTNGRQSSSSANTRKKTSVRALVMHPSLPRIAYMAEETIVSGGPSQPINQSKKNKSPRSGSAPSPSQQTTTVKHQHLIIQQFNRNHGFNENIIHNKNSNDILATLPMENLPLAINKFRQPKSKSSKVTQHPFTLASLGPLQSISFLDCAALFWATRRHYGSLSNLERAASMMNREKNDIVLRADYDPSNVAATGDYGGMGYGLCLGLQFSRALVLVRFHNNPKASSPNNSTSEHERFIVLCCLEGQRQTSGKDTKVQYTPTSAPLPISNSVVVYGCSDGAMRFHNLVPSLLYSTKMDLVTTPLSSNSSSSSSVGKSSKQTRQSTIKSVRGPNGRNDPVVQIVNVDPAYHASSHLRGDTTTAVGIPTQVGGEAGNESDDVNLILRSRILTVCASGVAFLWDVHITLDRSSGALRDLNVLPPLVRLDGLGSLTVSPRKLTKNPTQSYTPGGFWERAVTAKEGSGSANDPPYTETATPSVTYDPHRRLLLWSLPANAPASSIDHRSDYELESLSPNSPEAKKDYEDRVFFGKWATENGGFVKVWDLSLVDALIASAVERSSSSPRPPPKMPPAAIMKLPTSVTALTHQGIMAGLPHAPLTMASVACLCLTRDGSKLIVYAAPLPSAANSSMDDGLDTQTSVSESPVKNKRKNLGGKAIKPKVLFVNSAPCHSVALAGGNAMSPFTRGSAVTASYLNPDFVGVGTDQGVVIAKITEGESWCSKVDPLSDRRSNLTDVSTIKDGSDRTLRPNIPTGPIHTIISIGGVGNRPGILFVENHAVHASRLGTIRSSNDPKQALVENVELPDTMMLYKLHGRRVPWRTQVSTRMSNFVQVSQPMACPPRLISSPSGRYLCLYWERQRSYEILHAGSLLARDQSTPGGPANALENLGQRVTPSVDAGRNVLSFAWVGDEDNFAVLRQRSDPSISKSKDGDWSGTSIPTQVPKKQGRRQVELFKLAEVKVDAVELAAGASVAAATTASLGSLTVRGGDRYIPNVLFGGPALCVGCVSLSDRSNASSEEGIAYFYSRKGAAIEENDERASVYMTIGTSIPYPDLVAWDDFGQLCAVSYGSRVAVYLSMESKFVLLGSVRIVWSGCFDAELPLISLKFIHGVLYCSTKSSVHVIFLGNIEDEDAVCELDLYTIATDDIPLGGMDNPDLSSPVPVITALAKPHILAYHSGGLLVSTTCGMRLLPLSHPIIRIGTLLAANLIDRARKWILAFPKAEHDNLAHFLIRRGHVDLAISDLNGLSLETYIDLCMQYEYSDELEHLINAHGSRIIREICDWGRSETNSGYSGYLAIGLYMLGIGKIECAKKLVNQGAESNVRELLVDAMKLATFVSAVDKPEGNALLQKVTHAIEYNENGQLALVNVVN